MKTLQIRRMTMDAKDGTSGLFIYENRPFSVTLEPEYDDNRPSKNGVAGACIPAGEYLCKRVDSPTYGDTFEITDVLNRTHVLFHWGNFKKNTHACVLCGESFEPIDGVHAIRSSKQAFREFKGIIGKDDEFRLIIVDDWKNPIN